MPVKRAKTPPKTVTKALPKTFTMIEDDVLISEARDGDPGAFGALYDRYQPRIYRFIYLKVGRREEAEDLTHQVFLGAWEHMPSYRERGFPFSSWLYRIARNTVVDYYRSRRRTEPLEDLDPDAVVSGESIEQSAAQALLLRDVRRAVATLKPEHQDIIILRFVDELSVKEAAEALEKSEGAVKLLQHRAMRELRKRLGVPVEEPSAKRDLIPAD
jgi:RNA polymerase sigma-70 factor (ECF subfamily)